MSRLAADPDGSRVPVRDAVILAAGLGRRLGLFTRRVPKPLLPVAGVPMLERTLASLAAAGVERAMIVTGHLGGQIEVRFGQEYGSLTIEWVRSTRFRMTNDVYSLWLARERLCRDSLVLQADVVFDPRLLGALATAPMTDNLIAVAPHRPEQDGTVVSLGPDGRVEAMFYATDQGPGFDYDGKFKTMNIYLFREEFLRECFVPTLNRLVLDERRTGECFEKVLDSAFSDEKWTFRGIQCPEMPWYEVDTHEDRRTAERQLLAAADRFEILAGEHGGYWRHDVTDHRLLSNPHFPSAELLDDLARYLRETVVHYPVGQRPLASIAADAFDLDDERLVVANGSSELIKALVVGRGWRVAVPVPSFNEYENSTPSDLLTCFELPTEDFHLDVEEFAATCGARGAQLAAVVSPNNPTSIAVSADELRWLVKILRRENCRLLIDESFVDFGSDPKIASLAGDVEANPNLLILKSISKAYGVGGLRLGYVVCGDLALARSLREALSIWNINGVAEEFLRILPRYQEEFEESCILVRRECDGLRLALGEVEGVQAFPSDANFVFLRLPEGRSAVALAEELLLQHGLLVKDCGGKNMRSGDSYMRIASRTEGENARLIAAFREALRRPPASAKTPG